MSAFPRDLVFVMPDGSEAISGGNHYNAKLFAALGEPSRRVAIGDFAGNPLALATYLLDTLNLDCAKAALARRSEEGARFVLLVHHLPSFEPGLLAEHPSRVLEREVLGRFDGYIATGEFARAWLEEQGLGKRTILLEPALAVGDIGESEYSESVSALMVCNLIARKGVLAFLERLAEQLAERPTKPFALTILGRHDLDAGYAHACSEYVAASAHLSSCITLGGAIPHSQVGAHYRASNLVLSASRMETYGIALQEARHYGVPILAVRGGNSEQHVTHGRTGEVVETPALLADSLLRLVGDSERHAGYLRGAADARPADTEWTQVAYQLRNALNAGFDTA